MAISLYDISVASYLQTLGGVAGFLEAGKAHCDANDVDLDKIIKTRLYPDMWPFHDQIISVAHHSLGSIRGLLAGLFQPPELGSDLDYTGLQGLVGEAITQLQKCTRETVDALEGNEVLFQAGKFEMRFATEDFVMSFSLPNLYFHATTAYGILRMNGVPIGKLNFMGQMRMRK